MFTNQTASRFSCWAAAFRVFGRGVQRLADRSRRHLSRSLRVESLEQRTLLSVATLANTWKDVALVGSGTVRGAFAGEGVTGSFSGKMTDIHGTMHYTSATEGVLVEGTSGGTGNGTWSGRSFFVSGSGTWSLTGHAENLTDTSGALAGDGVADSFNTDAPLVPDIVGVPYPMTGTFDTKTFKVHADFPADSPLGQFNGTVKDTSTVPFDVVVTPAWDGDKVDVDVDVPGPVQKAASHTTAVTNIDVYWAKGPNLSNKIGKSLDTIPIYWNEASGQYEVDGLLAAPVGATHVLFVTKVGGKPKVAALALPTVSVAPATVDEGSGLAGAPVNNADFKVTLSQPFSEDVTVWYTTVKGKADKAARTTGATPGVDYGDPGKKKEVANSIVIKAGDTEGHILVPILGNTKFEPDKTFSIRLTQAQNAGIDKTLAQAKGAITNDDPPPAIRIADASVIEPTRGTAKMQFVVTLSNPSYQKIQVKYKTADGTALAGEDYSATQGTLTFIPGKTSLTFTVTVKADKQVGDETFLVNLIPFGTSDATIGDGQAVGTITNSTAATAAGAASRDAALGQLATSGQLAACFDQLGRMKNDKDAAAADSVLAAL